MKAHSNLCEEILEHTSLMIFQVIHSDDIICDREGSSGLGAEKWKDEVTGVMNGWRDEE